MTARRSATEIEIPLCLTPTAIARQIKTQGKAVYSISVKRTHLHHYNITVRTKSVNREFKTRNDRAQLFADNPIEDMISNKDSGGAI
jgi:hypothetical protein